jgi:hypothetical protein
MITTISGSTKRNIKYFANEFVVETKFAFGKLNTVLH